MSVDTYGKVYLVGAGPGNPELLTQKALRLIQRADIVLYDRLVNPFMLQLVKPDAVLIDVGKKPYHIHVQQQDINEKLIKSAKQYECVVRLKGGDPAIFGRVHEEVVALSNLDISFEIVPGITSASAAASSLGIGLTIRDISTSVTLTTGHFKDDMPCSIDVSSLLKHGTLAIYMGVKELKRIMDKIFENTHVDYPVVVIYQTSTTQEKCISGTVTTIANKVKRKTPELKPAIIIVGNIVAHHHIKVDATTNDSKAYLVSGPRMKAIERAYQIYEQGHCCMINPKEKMNFHETQQQFLKQELTKRFDEIIHI